MLSPGLASALSEGLSLDGDNEQAGSCVGAGLLRFGQVQDQAANPLAQYSDAPLGPHGA